MKTGWVPVRPDGSQWIYEHGQDGMQLTLSSVMTEAVRPPRPDQPLYPTLQAAAAAQRLRKPEEFVTIPRDNTWVPEFRLCVQDMSGAELVDIVEPEAE
jgi:hypothetical protein